MRVCGSLWEVGAALAGADGAVQHVLPAAGVCVCGGGWGDGSGGVDGAVQQVLRARRVCGCVWDDVCNVWVRVWGVAAGVGRGGGSGSGGEGSKTLST